MSAEPTPRPRHAESTVTAQLRRVPSHWCTSQLRPRVRRLTWINTGAAGSRDAPRTFRAENPMKTDRELKTDVVRELEFDPSVPANQIGVEVKDGVVTVSGHVETYAAKWAAQKAAQRVRGVKGVAVELDVIVPGSHWRTDSDIAKAVRDMLDWNASIPKDAVQVMVDHGYVTLSGKVPWAFARSAAESTVRGLVGVTGVSNIIEVETQARPRDVKRQISAALHRRAQLDATAIDVAVDQSTVTLNGVVDSWAEREAAEQAAWNAPGVSRVIDNLIVGF
ncbi:MAG TPA: BON domain-containing protein [Rudaea sp.]